MNELLKVDSLCIEYDNPNGTLYAVNGVSFDVKKGEVFALVGESGCGKSTTARAVMGLIDRPGKISAGKVEFGGSDLLSLKPSEMDDIRGKHIGMIFQNPLDSLNPVYTVGRQIMEGLIRDGVDKRKAYDIALQSLKDVQIPDAERRMRSYPHEISGGMRQRVMIAMMLCRQPDLLIADEPTTALDVTIQAGILELMRNLSETNGTAILLITHDFGVVADMADRVGVMYAGEIVEIADTETIFDDPVHPYTRMLMRSLPTITKAEGRLKAIEGTVPDLAEVPAGCGFADRCPHATEACFKKRPVLTDLGNGHSCACHVFGKTEEDEK